MEGIPLFEAEQCHVFKIPSGDQLKSELWEGNHIWSGSLRVFQDRIELFDSNGVFGACPLRDDPEAPIPVKPTTDSRRCFIVRVEQGGMFAYLGINFETHNIAFQFHTAVLERHRTASNREVETVEVHDRRLRPGQTFNVELAGKVRVKDSNGVVLQHDEQPAPAVTGFDFNKPIAGARPGANRRIGSTAPAATAPVASPTGQQPQAAQSQLQPPAVVPTSVAPPMIDPFAAPPVETQRAPPPPVARAPDPFDPFGPTTAPAAPAPPKPAAKPVDPLDALFS